MTDLSRDELIGAYLDDELSAEDRARVESLLAESEESRQMLEELRALRSHLQSLPRHTLPADFSQQVLKRAEREMLLGRTSAGERAPSVARREDAQPATIPFGRRWARPLVYAGLAIAAALMISFLLPNQIQQRGDVRLAERGGEESEPSENAIAADESPRQPMAESVAKSAPPAGRDDPAMPAFRGTGERPTPNGQLELPDAAAPEPEAAYSADRRAAADGVLIVDCRITREALTAGAFEQVLGEAAIAVEAEDGSERDKEAGDATTVFYVEATPEEIESALAALVKRGEEFPTVEIDPAGDDDRQVEWRKRFARGEDSVDRAPGAPPEADADRPRSEEPDAKDQPASESLRDYVADLLPAKAESDEPVAQASEGRSTARRLPDADRREKKPALGAAAPAEAAEQAPAEVRAGAGGAARAKRGDTRVTAVFVLRVADVPPAAEAAPSSPERDEQ